jgi:hypothetical protein
VTRLRRDVTPIGIGLTGPSQDFPVVPPRMAKRGETQTRRGTHWNRSH